LENFVQIEVLSAASAKLKSEKPRRSYSDDVIKRARPEGSCRGGSHTIFSKPISLTLSPPSQSSPVPNRVRKHQRSKSGTDTLKKNSSNSPSLSHASSDASGHQKEKKRSRGKNNSLDLDWMPPKSTSHRRAKSGFIVIPKLLEIPAPPEPKIPDSSLGNSKQRNKRAHSGFIASLHKTSEGVKKRQPPRERPRSGYFTSRELKRMRTIKNDYHFDSDDDDDTTTMTTQDPSSTEWSIYSIQSGGTHERSSTDVSSGSMRRIDETKTWDFLTAQKIKSLQQDIRRKDQEKVRPYEIPKLEIPHKGDLRRHRSSQHRTRRNAMIPAELSKIYSEE